MVAMSVGACLGGDEPCREQIAEKQRNQICLVPKRRCFGQRGSPRFYLQLNLDSNWTVEQISGPSADFERLGRFQIAAGTQAAFCQRSAEHRWTGWVV